MKRSPLLTEELFEAGIILPDCSDPSLELSRYRERREFWSKELEARRMLCPDLFLVGSNAINNDAYFCLNLRMVPELQREFPLVPFETQEDFRRFLKTPTFYLVNWLGEMRGDDLLGNEYRSLRLSVVFLRICPGDPMGEYDVYSQDELVATFLQYNDFINLKWRPQIPGLPPTTHSKMMTSFEIARIERLLQNLLQDYSEAETLLDVIQGIRTGLTHRLQIVEDLRSSANEEMKGFFYAVLYAGMRMRGWLGKGPYPLKSIETSGQVDDVALIDRLMSLLNSPKEWLELPLFNYITRRLPEELVPTSQELLAPVHEIEPRILQELVEQQQGLDELLPEEGEFQISTNLQEGLTILERILVVLKNENDYSCIRLSSGWFCSTAWYYLHFYFGIEPFRLEDLAWIS